MNRLFRKKDKKKDKDKKKKKQKGSADETQKETLSNQTSQSGSSTASDTSPNDQIGRADTSPIIQSGNFDPPNVKDEAIPAMPTQMASSSQSQDDMAMTADDLKRKQQKVKRTQKRHSHIGAMRPHSSSKTNKLGVPATLEQGDEEKEDDSQANGHKNGSTVNMGGSMMASSATNKRLEQLMAMRAGKDAKGNRSRSVNVKKAKEKENRYPKKRRSEVHKEPRRHSMFPDKVCALHFRL